MIVGTGFLPRKRVREAERKSLSLVKLEIDTGSSDSTKTSLGV